MGRLFGTDGVRGVANRELTPLLAFYLGRAFGAHLLEAGQTPRIIVGRDTRLSGPMLEGALAAGAASTGVDVCLAGVIPTPGVAYLVRRENMGGGVVISASHNPAQDNGIKFFAGDGFKLSDAMELTIEAMVSRLQAGKDGLPMPVAGALGRIMQYPEAAQLYSDWLGTLVTWDLSGLKVILDCAHGATVPVAGALFRTLGARTVELNVEPDGLNINVQCGSTHPEVLQEAVLRHEADIGFAFDGDGDRLIAVDSQGRIVDGDRILAICGRHLLDRNQLPRRTLAATTYSNLGLIEAIETAGGRVLITDAGDRNVLETMRANGLKLGGEQSGHIIFLDENSTGDGLLTAVQLLKVMYEREASLADLYGEMQAYPQHLINIRVADKAWQSNPRIVEAVEEANNRLGVEGRIFVRASGTEPVIRILGEGRHADLVESVVQRVGQVIAEELGV